MTEENKLLQLAEVRYLVCCSAAAHGQYTVQ